MHIIHIYPINCAYNKPIDYWSWLGCDKWSMLCWNLNFMITSSNGNILHVTGPLWGNPLVTGGFPSQGPVTWSFDVFCDVRIKKWLSKLSRCWWFEIPCHSLWCHCNVVPYPHYKPASFSWLWLIKRYWKHAFDFPWIVEKNIWRHSFS